MKQSTTIRTLTATDAAILDSVADEVFDNEVRPKFAQEFLADPRHHIAVAMVDGVVVGIATAVHYIHPDKPPELWINEVGVAPEYQRQGIATQLMKALFALGVALGCRQAWLGTEEENTPARHLYASLGGTEETMVSITFQLS
ncbi:MAG: GNAT family N-acetyltransferase [Chlorobi bacterium]|nr:GNAT family N-acetyltransferase [Chlorobiota bacterium]